MTRDIDWGIPVPLDGWREQPDQAAVRLVRRGDRLPVRVDRVGAPARRPRARGGTGGTTRRPLSYYFMGKDNITFHSQIWPAELLAYDGEGDARRRAGGVRRAQPADRGGLQRVPDHGEQAVLLQPWPRHPTCATCWRATRPTRCATSSARPARDLGHRLHLGGVRAAHQLRAGRRLGQPGQPDRDDDRQELRRDPRRRRLEPVDEAVLAAVRAASRRSATSSAGTASARRSPRRCGWSAR